MSLKQAINIALEYNPQLAAQRQDVSAAAARKDLAFSRALPNIRARTSYTDYINDQPLITIGGDPRGQTFTDKIANPGLLLDMPIFTSGRIINQIKAAELLRKASSHTLARTIQEMIFNVSSVFYSILAQEKVIESLQFSLKALREHLKQVKKLIANQKATKVDRLRIEVRLANVQENLARFRNILEVERYALANLLGIENIAGVLELKGKLDFKKKSLPPFKDAVREAYKKRMDYQAAKRNVEAVARQLDVARSELWPIIDLEASYGERWDVSNISKHEDAGWFGVTLSLPLFEGGRLRAAIREEKSKLAAAQERLRKLKLQVRLDVQTALSMFLQLRNE